MIEDGALSKPLSERYSKWDSPSAQKMLRGELKLDEIAALVERDNINPQPKSGRQEYLRKRRKSLRLKRPKSFMQKS